MAVSAPTFGKLKLYRAPVKCNVHFSFFVFFFLHDIISDVLTICGKYFVDVFFFFWSGLSLRYDLEV